MTAPAAHPARNALRIVGLLVVAVVLFLGVMEIGLRLSGFRYVLLPEDIEFGRPGPVEIRVVFQPDDDLFWVSRGYSAKLEEYHRNPPDLLFLGDSCTQFGRWDEILARKLAEETGSEPRWGNLAVAGWSSYQGRRQLERDVVPLAPKVITLYYGWNDHWIGFGIEDRTVAQVRSIFSSRWSGLRTVQLGTRALVAWRARESGFPERVSLADFADNLRSMVRTSRSHGIEPLLITAASAHRPGAEPSELGERWLRRLSDLVPLHQAYVEVVRRVAAEEETPLCDAAAHFAALEPAQLAPLFLADGIHWTPEGDRALAEVLDGCFARSNLLAALRVGAPQRP